MRACERCVKAGKMGGTRQLLRGKYNPTGWNKKKPNLQWTSLLVLGKRSQVCTKCLRTLSRAK